MGPSVENGANGHHSANDNHTNGGAPPYPAPAWLDSVRSDQSWSDAGEQATTLLWPPPSPPAPASLSPPPPEAPTADEPPSEPAHELSDEAPPVEVEALPDIGEAPPVEDEAPPVQRAIPPIDVVTRSEPSAVVAPGPVRAPADTPAAPLTATPDALAVAEEPHQAGFLDRGRLRRRARYLRRLREIQLRDIGGFAVEMHRFGRERPDLLAAKVAGAARIDRELRALERALGEPQSVRQLREAGVGGACESCGAVHGSGENFCSCCGAALSRSPDLADDRPGPAGGAS
ncbi:MAG: hypothetical protein ACR2LV_11795 [Solirubrobacteraceae bacterium]